MIMAIAIAIAIRASADNPSLVGFGVGEGVAVFTGVGEGVAVDEGVGVGEGVAVGDGVGVGLKTQVTLTVLVVKWTSSLVTSSYKDETVNAWLTAEVSMLLKLAVAFF
jgi:UDP-3-O-[3-hydroxymyristoyl] glucosamine N-acyltransferase